MDNTCLLVTRHLKPVPAPIASNAENYIVRLAGHNMTLIALDGVDVEPIQITTLNMHIGERADVIVCADQKPGYYPMEMTYDCTLF